MLPKSAQVARSVSNLFNRSRVSKKVDWIFPISRNSCVQLELSGTIEGTDCLCAALKFYSYILLFRCHCIGGLGASGVEWLLRCQQEHFRSYGHGKLHPRLPLAMH